MYCTNCAREVHPQAIACPGCGVPPRLERKHCWNCAVACQPNQVVCTQCGVSLGGSPAGQAGAEMSQRVVAAILAILLGWIGVHKFYMGQTNNGIIRLVVGIVGMVIVLPGLVLWVIAIIEGITYLSMSDQAFQDTYIRGGKQWF